MRSDEVSRSGMRKENGNIRVRIFWNEAKRKKKEDPRRWLGEEEGRAKARVPGPGYMLHAALHRVDTPRARSDCGFVYIPSASYRKHHIACLVRPSRPALPSSQASRITRILDFFLYQGGFFFFSFFFLLFFIYFLSML